MTYRHSHLNHWKQRTKIVCTLGPATKSASSIERLIKAGMNVARLNLSHGTLEEHALSVKLVREMARQLKTDVAILLDLPGPKYRTGAMKDPSVTLKKGSTVTLTPRDIPGDDKIISINLPTLAQDVKIGSVVLVDDGAMELKVKAIEGGDVVCRVIVGGLLSPGRGVVVPGERVSAPFLSQNLRDNLAFAIQQQPDYIALSFVSDVIDIQQVKAVLDQSQANIPLITKIERSEAVRNFDHILAISDGIMVARGDLGVELPLKVVPSIQKEIIHKCNQAGKPVITATQMLESMVNAARPTRAEVSDVANAILDSTDAIMLSAETSVGKYPLQAVKMMVDIARETEHHLPFDRTIVERGQWLERQTSELISYNACYTAYQLKAAAIVAFTQTGGTARRVSKYRPPTPILAITPDQQVARRLMLNWGVQAFQIENPTSVDDMFKKGTDLAKDLGLAKEGDIVVITGGIPLGMTGTTNMLRVQKV
jgi:pyruvate kinase